MRVLPPLLIGLGLLAPVAATAHPHVWVDGTLTAHLTPQTMIDSVTVEWVFDDAYSAYTLEGRDRNRNGRYEPKELHDLIDGAMDRLVEWRYFTDIRDSQNTRTTFAHARDAVASVKDGKLVFTFTLPLATPVAAQGATLRLYDPSFYMDVAPAEQDPVRFDPAGHCQATFHPPPPMQESMLMSESMFRQEITPETEASIGLAYAASLSVECTP